MFSWTLGHFYPELPWMPCHKVTAPKTQWWPGMSIGTSLFSPFPPCDVWLSLSVSPQFISDSKALTGPKITFGTIALERTTDSMFLTYISCHSCQTSSTKSSYGFFSLFFFICLYTKVQISFCFCWHRQCLHEQFQFTPVVLTKAGLLLNQTQMKPCTCAVLRESGVLELAFQRLHLVESSQLGWAALGEG